jgi:stage II sporulation protein D
MRSRWIPFVATLALAAACGAYASNEEDLPLEAAEPLPPVKVRLSSLGSPSKLVVRGTGATITNGAGQPVSAALPLTVTAAGGTLRAAGVQSSSLRIEGNLVTLEVGKTTRHYPGTVLLTASGARVVAWNECSLDEYVEGVLSGECPALFHPEAIKAMAVAARSYGYRKAFLNPAELCDTTHCQVYLGHGRVSPSHREAVADTSGLCALYEGEVIDAVYSADCGGYTEANEDAWRGARPLPYLRPVEDAPEPHGESFCSVNRSHHWKITLPLARLRSLAGKAGSDLRLAVLDVTESGRVRALQLGPAPAQKAEANGEEPVVPQGGKRFSGEEWRRMLGLSQVRSLRFEVRHTAAGVALEGRGYGHGVGLCQFGANGMGRFGYDFGDILQHYYSGIEIRPAPCVKAARALITQRRQAPPTATE